VSDVEDITKSLNRLYRLYTQTIYTARPYRVYPIRRLYQEAFALASGKYEIRSFESIIDYEMLLGPLPGLSLLIERKHDALSRSEYEEAAALRDMEKEFVRRTIQQSGRDPDDHFFAVGDIILYKHW
jgi:hypothetical protein